MRKIIIIIILLVMLAVCSSCAGSRELDDLAIVTATSLDIEDGKIILTNEVVIPSATAPDSPVENKTIYIQSEGDTIFEAFRNATLELDKKLYISHNMVLIFGEEFAKRGIGDYMGFYLNDAEPRETAYVLVAKGDKGYNLIGIDIGIGLTTGDYLRGLMENHKYTSKIRKLTLYEYFKYFFDYKAPVTGSVQKVKKAEIDKKNKQDKSSKLALNVGGGAVFKKDRLEGYYTEDEMIGYNFMLDEIEAGLIVFEMPDNFIDYEELVASTGKFTSIGIVSSRTKKDIKMIDGDLHLTINVRLKGVLGEETRGVKLTELAVKDAIQNACSDKVEEYIRMVMDKAQKEFQIDNFAIKRLVYIKYPDIWKKVSDDWDEGVFPNISYSVNVKTSMIRTGLITIPPNIEKGREE